MTNNLAAAVELVACPFCGATELERNDSVFWTGMKNEVTRYRIQHHCKDAQGRTYRRIEVAGTTYDEMADAWNTRPPALGELSDEQWYALLNVMDAAAADAASINDSWEDINKNEIKAAGKAARAFLGKVE